MPVRTAQDLLDVAADRFRSPPSSPTEPLSFGIDLGTSTCVLTAIDAGGEPVYVDSVECAALRDGVVVDFAGVVEAVGRLKKEAEASLDRPVDEAATAYPPGIPAADGQACAYALEQAGVECRELLDEVTAANRLLGIDTGVVVDVGAGSTGVGVYREGEVVDLVDSAGGGHHLDLILAGGLGVSLEEARAMKHTQGPDLLNFLRPGIERVASRIAAVTDAGSGSVHLIGGGLMIPGAAEIVERFVGLPVIAYSHSLFVTPLGLAFGGSE